MLFITAVGWWMDCWSCRAWEGGERARAERPALHASRPGPLPLPGRQALWPLSPLVGSAHKERHVSWGCITRDRKIGGGKRQKGTPSQFRRQETKVQVRARGLCSPQRLQGRGLLPLPACSWASGCIPPISASVFP